MCSSADFFVRSSASSSARAALSTFVTKFKFHKLLRGDHVAKNFILGVMFQKTFAAVVMFQKLLQQRSYCRKITALASVHCRVFLCNIPHVSETWTLLQSKTSSIGSFATAELVASVVDGSHRCSRCWQSWLACQHGFNLEATCGFWLEEQSYCYGWELEMDSTC